MLSGEAQLVIRRLAARTRDQRNSHRSRRQRHGGRNVSSTGTAFPGEQPILVSLPATEIDNPPLIFSAAKAVASSVTDLKPQPQMTPQGQLPSQICRRNIRTCRCKRRLDFSHWQAQLQSKCMSLLSIFIVYAIKLQRECARGCTGKPAYSINCLCRTDLGHSRSKLDSPSQKIKRSA